MPKGSSALHIGNNGCESRNSRCQRNPRTDGSVPSGCGSGLRSRWMSGNERGREMIPAFLLWLPPARLRAHPIMLKKLPSCPGGHRRDILRRRTDRLGGRAPVSRCNAPRETGHEHPHQDVSKHQRESLRGRRRPAASPSPNPLVRQRDRMPSTVFDPIWIGNSYFIAMAYDL